MRTLTQIFLTYLTSASRKKAEKEIKQVFEDDEEGDICQEPEKSPNAPVEDDSLLIPIIDLFFHILNLSTQFKYDQKLLGKFGTEMLKVFYFLGIDFPLPNDNFDEALDHVMPEMDIFSLALHLITKKTVSLQALSGVFQQIMGDVPLNTNFKNAAIGVDSAPKVTNECSSSENNDEAVSESQSLPGEPESLAPRQLPINVKQPLVGNSLQARHIIPITDAFVNHFTPIKRLCESENHTVHVLNKVLSHLDLVKDSKSVRDVIRFIDDHFSSSSPRLVPQKSMNGYESTSRHRNKIIVELTEAFRYSNHLIQGTCGSPVEPDDISILICQDILENMTYFDLISKIKHAGIGISDAALLDNGYRTLGLLLLLKPFLQIDFH